MPLQTFYNLPEEKRARLMEAIRQEFSRVSFDRVSINKIVQAAGIPRGSFYQYFRDKEDVLRYLLTDYKKRVYRRILQSLSEHGGDIFRLFVDLLDFTVDFVTREPHNAFFRNLLQDIRINRDFYASFSGRGDLSGGEGPSGGDTPGSIPLGERLFHMDDSGELRALLPHMNTENLDIRGPQDLTHMLGVLRILTGEAIARMCCDTARCAQIREEYMAKLSLLARGFVKNKES